MTEPPPLPAPEGSRPSPRMRDVATRAGVHQTTVSLALRNHASIPAATRDRIRAIAEEMGYRPNPLLDAFNFHRQSNHPVKSPPTIALVIDDRSNRVFQKNGYHPLIIKGMRLEAAVQGLQVELFVTGPDSLSAARLNSILVARGISGVVVAPFYREVERLDLDWDRLCAVKIESRHLWPPLEVISNDQCQATRLAFTRLRALGYRRIGMVICHDDEQRLGDPFRAGLLVEQLQIPAADRVPPLTFWAHEEGELRARVGAWVRNERIDAVISNWNHVVDELGDSIGAGRRRIARASIDKDEDHPEVAGVVQNHVLVGRRAVEQVRSLLQISAWGVPEAQSITLVPGYWVDGPSAPARLRAE